MEQETNTETEQSEGEGSGIDSIISTVKSYIQDPKLVTPETLTSLKADLEDLKGYLDGEEPEDEVKSEPEEKGDGGLMIMIGKAKNKGEMK